MLSLTTMQLLWIVLLSSGFGALLVSGLMLMLLTLGQRDLDDERTGRKPVHLGDLPDRRRNPDTDDHAWSIRNPPISWQSTPRAGQLKRAAGNE